MSKSLLVLVVVASGLVGCGNDAADKMSSGVTVESWPERDELDNAIMGAAMAAEMGSWGEAQKTLDDTALKSALDSLAASEAPGGYDEEKKQAVVEAGKGLIEAKSGKPQDFEGAYQKFVSAMKDMQPSIPE